MTGVTEAFNLIDGFLPAVQAIQFHQPGELQGLYAGVGMPSLRIAEVAHDRDFRTYHAIKAANSLLSLVEPMALHARYVCLRAEALQEDEDALNDLGWLWLNGSRLPADPLLARRLFKLAAVQGSGEALYNLATQSYYGKGVPVDPALAIGYYELAYERGVTCAAGALGALYAQGDDGLVADHDLAYEWYLKGAQDGDLEAAFALGCLSLDQASIRFDVATGLYWLQWAATQGHCMAAEHLADFYRSPFNWPDLDRHLYYFWRDHAIRLGSNWAQEMKS